MYRFIAAKFMFIYAGFICEFSFHLYARAMATVHRQFVHSKHSLLCFLLAFVFFPFTQDEPNTSHIYYVCMGLTLLLFIEIFIFFCFIFLSAKFVLQKFLAGKCCGPAFHDLDWRTKPFAPSALINISNKI